MSALGQHIGVLSTEDLLRFRIYMARENTIARRPDAFSAVEIEHHELDGFKLQGELVKKYDLDATRRWRFSAYTGVIWYAEE